MPVPRFWRKIRHRYNLIGSVCRNCGTYYYPPRNLCPTCRRAGKMEEYQFKGTGKVVSYTVIRTPPDQFQELKPYVLGIVELDEGPRVTSQIICDPEEAKIGMRVRQVFRKYTEDGEDGVIYYGTKFEPEDEEYDSGGDNL